MWQKPNIGEHKCNVDAAIFKEKGIFGLGLCVRNDKGEFVKAKSMWFYGVPTPHEAEAKGLLEALKWMASLNLYKVTFELDCKSVVDGILEDKIPFTEFGCILATCKDSLKFFQNYGVSFIRRQANNIAHSLAKASRFCASHHVFYYIPTCISNLILNQMK